MYRKGIVKQLTPYHLATVSPQYIINKLTSPPVEPMKTPKEARTQVSTQRPAPLEADERAAARAITCSCLDPIEKILKYRKGNASEGDPTSTTAVSNGRTQPTVDKKSSHYPPVVKPEKKTKQYAREVNNNQ